MPIRHVTADFAVHEQLQIADIETIAKAGFKTVICNRPDDEAGAVPSASIAAACEAQGLDFVYMPVVSSAMTAADAATLGATLAKIGATGKTPVLAYCRSGTRSQRLFDMAAALAPAASPSAGGADYDVVIVGGGAAGIAVASSLLERDSSLKMAIIDPSSAHFYQPGWTMVGGGIFTSDQTVKTMASQIPGGVKWINKAVVSFAPDQNLVTLDDGRDVGYAQLVVCPGLTLNWGAIDGLATTLGQNGVTSNYRFDLAPYTWELVQSMRGGTAIFTQPPMPIKCAGAPQKAMYLSADHWHRTGVLKDISIDFCNAGGALFGVEAYVPALMEYVKKYNAGLQFFYNLVAIDGPRKLATFEVKQPDQPVTRVEKPFDMIHVCPPQIAPDFISQSPLADAGGWVDVDQHSLRHKRHDNIWGLGDATNTPNAKTAAAVRKQAPIVAVNLLAARAGKPPVSHYQGYGSCPLTVERGKIVLAEFGYGGALDPTFPAWVNDGTKPSRLAWFLKEKLLPPLYWHGMLKGKEWLASPKLNSQ